MKAKGINTGNSLIDYDHLPCATKALSTFNDKILLSTHHVVASSPTDGSASVVRGDIPDNMVGFDIGNETIECYSFEVGGEGSGTVFWNGSMGLFEI